MCGIEGKGTTPDLLINIIIKGGTQREKTGS